MLSNIIPGWLYCTGRNYSWSPEVLLNLQHCDVCCLLSEPHVSVMCDSLLQLNFKCFIFLYLSNSRPVGNVTGDPPKWGQKGLSPPGIQKYANPPVYIVGKQFSIFKI